MAKQKLEYNPLSHCPLTQQQKNWSIGLILSDGWIKNHWLYIRQCEENVALIQEAQKVFGGLVRGEVVNYTNKKSGRINNEIRIGPHPYFVELAQIFYPYGNFNKKKTLYEPVGGRIMPTVDWLNQHLNFEILAVWLMGDGSRKSSENKSIEIHTEGLTYNSATRGAIAIFETLGITAKVLVEESRNVPVIYVCGENIELLISKVKPLMHPDFHYKIPTKRVRAYNPLDDSACTIWYNEFKDAEFRNDQLSCKETIYLKNEEKQTKAWKNWKATNNNSL